MGEGSGVTRRYAAGLIAGAVALLVCAGCGIDSPSSHQGRSGNRGASSEKPAATPDKTKELPGVGTRLRAEVPADARQVVAVYGNGPASADAQLVLYRKTGGDLWKRDRVWSAHNGRKGWTTDHHEGDKKSPVGVFTLSDAGGVLPDPGAKFPYHASSAFTPPAYWGKSTSHDFDYVIAIDYNRVRGTSPLDSQRPDGYAKGGGIWIHMDHGSGTSACVSIPKTGMEYLLRTLDPKLHPVVVMGDRSALAA